MRGRADDKLSQGGIERVLRVGAVKAVITVASTGNEMRRFQLGQLILHRLQREIAQARELTHMQLRPRIRKEKPKDFRTHQREPPMQERLLYCYLVLSRPL